MKTFQLLIYLLQHYIIFHGYGEYNFIYWLYTQYHDSKPLPYNPKFLNDRTAPTIKPDYNDELEEYNKGLELFKEALAHSKKTPEEKEVHTREIMNFIEKYVFKRFNT